MDDVLRQAAPMFPPVSDRAEVRARIQAVLPSHRAELGLESLALYGSFARDEADDESDVDLIVVWAMPPNFDRYLSLNDRLEKLLGREVQITELHLLHPLVRPRAERDLVPL
jgi:predicted nucleotidyltransferase